MWCYLEGRKVGEKQTSLYATFLDLFQNIFLLRTQGRKKIKKKKTKKKQRIYIPNSQNKQKKKPFFCFTSAVFDQYFLLIF